MPLPAAPATGSAPGRLTRLTRLTPLLIAALPLLAACGPGNGGASPQQTETVTAPSGSSPAASGSPGGSPASARPGILAVTAAGALVRLDPATGSAAQTLVPSGVYGDEITVSSNGSTAYYTQRSAACDLTIMSVSTSGGNPTPIAAGELPAISPDGTKVAFAREPLLTPDCIPGGANIAGDFKLVIRTLSSGTEKTLPLPPQVVHGGLFEPISHLSWAADGVRLAVSTSSVQDNEGWNLFLVDTSAATYYALPGSGVTAVPVTGSPDAQRNISLAADPSGQWLLYLAGADLYVSQDGNRPSKLASGFTAATWI